MNFKIRKYDISDFPLLVEWWVERQETPPAETMMPRGTSYVIEWNDNPIASMCWVITNIPDICYAAHFISDPNSIRDVRREAIRTLFDFICEEISSRSYKHILAFGYEEKLTDRFLKLGFRHTFDALNSFVKDL